MMSMTPRAPPLLLATGHPARGGRFFFRGYGSLAAVALALCLVVSDSCAAASCDSGKEKGGKPGKLFRTGTARVRGCTCARRASRTAA